MTKNHSQLLKIYSLNQGMHWFALGTIIPVLILVQLDRGFNLAEIGIAMAVMSVTVLSLELPTGGLADAVGRKRVYMISVIFSLAGYILILFASLFWHLVIIAIFLGIGRALSSGTIDAWFIDEHKLLGGGDEQLQKDLARAGTVIPAALGGGTLTGGFMPDLLGSWMNLHTPFGIYGPNIILIVILYFLQLLLTRILINEDISQRAGKISDSFRQFPGIIATAVKFGLGHRNTLAILLATAALGVGLSGLEQLWQPRIREISPDTGIWVMGLLATGYFLAAALGNALSTPLVKIFKSRYKHILFLFRFVMGILYLTLSFRFSLGGFAPFYLLVFLAHGMTESPEMTLFNRDIPGDKRSTLLSLNSLFLQAGGALGSLTVGQMAHRLSIPAAWWVTGGILTLSAAFYLLIREKKYENKI